MKDNDMDDSKNGPTMRLWDYLLTLAAIVALAVMSVYSLSATYQNTLIVDQNRLLLQQSAARLKLLTNRVNEWNLDQHGRWCEATEKLNPGWHCAPKEDFIRGIHDK